MHFQRLLLGILTILTFNACDIHLGDLDGNCEGIPELSITPKDYWGTELRTDGIFLSDSLIAPYYTQNEGILFYRSGHLRSLLAIQDSLFLLNENQPEEYERMERIGWGAFNIRNQRIWLDSWIYDWCGFYAFNYFAKREFGQIINDSTFVLKKWEIWDSQGKMNDEGWDNDTFRLYPLSPKPDSTFDFVF